MESKETQFESSSEEKSVSVHETENQSENESQRLQSEALAKALSSMLTTVIKEFDSKAQQTSTSQDHLSQSLDRLTRELDKLLEDAPLPFIMQHAAKISVVRKRVSSLNSVLKSVQRRLDNIDRMLSVGVSHQHQQQQQHGICKTNILVMIRQPQNIQGYSNIVLS
ncbi:uncharacterized protein LOC117624726 isoform X1 [Prunus dulcis]|uniref:uncharacterized protein LOC117624726 isoform X1 n=1 Tax=Prunus dulcis TaxID=3755 RepID=UPI0014835C05|nr:uncharacterized protein LOC117624726 isoform X1 [Prunus dulcis]